MDRYEVIAERLDDTKLFGKILKKGNEYFNIKDNKTESKLVYGYPSSFEKNPVIERCEYLNKYDKAEQFKLVEDGNGVYWVFIKSIVEDFGFKANNDVWYIKQKADDLYSLPNLNVGCNTLEGGKNLLKETRKMHEESKNSEIFKEVDI